MLRQNRMMRARALGNFHDLLVEVTADPAMLLWLSGTSNTKYSPNENYGREVMELFTLGADRGYSQHDVHQQARALTGFTNDWHEASGPVNFRFDPDLHDDGRQADLRPPRPLWLARHLPAVRRAPAAPLVHGRKAVGLLHRRAAVRAGAAAGARARVRGQRL